MVDFLFRASYDVLGERLTKNRDMSQVYGNPGFLDAVVAGLGGQSSGTTTTVSSPSTTTGSGPSTTTNATTLSTVTTSTTEAGCTAPTGSLVPQWGQCGGKDHKGPTQCQPPYKCIFVGEWWSHCA